MLIRNKPLTQPYARRPSSLHHSPTNLATHSPEHWLTELVQLSTVGSPLQPFVRSSPVYPHHVLGHQVCSMLHHPRKDRMPHWYPSSDMGLKAKFQSPHHALQGLYCALCHAIGLRVVARRVLDQGNASRIHLSPLPCNPVQKINKCRLLVALHRDLSSHPPLQQVSIQLRCNPLEVTLVRHHMAHNSFRLLILHDNRHHTVPSFLLAWETVVQMHMRMM